MRLLDYCKIALPFLISILLVALIISIPSCTYVLDKYFVMNKLTLLTLTDDGKKQKILKIPLCTEKIGVFAFQGNNVVEKIFFPCQLRLISSSAFSEEMIEGKKTTFVVPNEEIKKLLLNIGIPDYKIKVSRQKTV